MARSVMSRCKFYIDGFNLYEGRLKKSRHLRWLNVVAFSERLATGVGEVVQIEYYTAHVAGKIDREGQIRQATYLQALRTLRPKLRLHVGKFAVKERWVKPCDPFETRPTGIAAPSVMPDLLKATVAQEKESDVKLAVHLLHDAVRDEYDTAFVVSNDSDLTEAIRLSTEEYGKNVVLVPPAPERGGDFAPLARKLEDAATRVQHVRTHLLENCQFPNSVIKDNGRHVTCPADWR
ncbi:NYN domain-containing protein [Fontisubflavum oceani]|uniref:NYN domain-containing protein n=1 Tax=Fontisubflavum oceani TaxID=2978973 RepID=UPI0025B43810|nr:NYN domain-containing protein [Fontisubflavum oceani]WJY22763.1 NYN domain-containing protein [Fontisubflavum oceani]